VNKLTAVIGLASLLVGATAFANDIDPFGFEKDHFISSKSRAAVVADLSAAHAAGQLLLPGEAGQPVVDAPSIKPRAQVIAETLEAKRLGLITYGELPVKDATAEQARQIQMAGMKALELVVAQKQETGPAASVN
jgi:hypothetical protein